MSAPQPPETAIQAGINPLLYGFTQNRIADEIVKTVLTAALPHLHRDWLERLIGKAEAEVLHLEPYAGYPNTYGAFQRSARQHIIDWLTRELAEGGDGE